MAKQALLQRELKREKLAAKFAARAVRSVNSAWLAPRSVNWLLQVISPVSPKQAGKH